jgi:hypothetical protein
MERRKAELTQSYQYDSDYLNSKGGQKASNRLAILRGLTSMHLAYNTVAPSSEVPTLPENRLGEGVYRVGLDGFAKTGGPKWP